MGKIQVCLRTLVRRQLLMLSPNLGLIYVARYLIADNILTHR